MRGPRLPFQLISLLNRAQPQDGVQRRSPAGNLEESYKRYHPWLCLAVKKCGDGDGGCGGGEVEALDGRRQVR